MFLCRHVYGLVTSWTVRQKENVSLQFGCMVFKKRRHLWYMVKKNVYGLKTRWTVRPKENVSLHFGCMVILKKKAFMVHGRKKMCIVWKKV